MYYISTIVITQSVHVSESCDVSVHGLVDSEMCNVTIVTEVPFKVAVETAIALRDTLARTLELSTNKIRVFIDSQEGKPREIWNVTDLQY